MKKDFFEQISIAKTSAGMNFRPYLDAIDLEEIEKLKVKVIQENRDSKIEHIVDGKPYKQIELEDLPEYQEIISNGEVFLVELQLAIFTTKHDHV